MIQEDSGDDTGPDSIPEGLRLLVRIAVPLVVVLVAVFLGAREVLPSLGLMQPPTEELHRAVQAADLEEVKRLSTSSRNLKHRDSEGRLPIHHAFRVHGDQRTRAAVLGVLLSSGADPNALDAKGNSPLHLALDVPTRYVDKPRRVVFVSMLLEAGANPSIENDNGWSPLSRAVLRTVDGAVPLLFDAGATAGIIEAVLLGDTERSRELLDANPALANFEMPTLVTPLMMAVYQCDLDMTRLLLERDAFIDAQARTGFSPLHFAVYYGRSCRYEIAGPLLDAGASPNLPTLDSFDTPLLLAVRHAPHSIVQRLLDAGADPNLQNEEEDSSLMIAARRRGPDAAPIVDSLLEAGADPNLRGRRGSKPILFAANPQVIALLLDHGANPSFAEWGASTAFNRVFTRMPFTDEQILEIVTIMLEHGADPNETTSGTTVLAQAVANNSIPVIEVLLEAGADPHKIGRAHV